MKYSPLLSFVILFVPGRIGLNKITDLRLLLGFFDRRTRAL